MRIEILPTDRRDTTGVSKPEGHPRCLCSRCGVLIPEEDHAIRFWPTRNPNDYELRYHPACLGFESFTDPLE